MRRLAEEHDAGIAEPVEKAAEFRRPFRRRQCFGIGADQPNDLGIRFADLPLGDVGVNHRRPEVHGIEKRCASGTPRRLHRPGKLLVTSVGRIDLPQGGGSGHMVACVELGTEGGTRS